MKRPSKRFMLAYKATLAGVFGVWCALCGTGAIAIWIANYVGGFDARPLAYLPIILPAYLLSFGALGYARVCLKARKTTS